MLSDDACSQLIHALVTVRIDYCNSLLYGLPEYSLDRLQKIMNTAACILRKVPKFDHITETLMDLHWLPVHQRVTFKILILTYQAYHGTAPQYLCDLIVHYANTCNLRSNNKLLIAPCHPRANSLSARTLHRAPPPRLQVDQNFLTQKIVADPKMRCHQISFGIWRVTEAILGQKTCFFSKKHILEKNHNKSHYFFKF